MVLKDLLSLALPTRTRPSFPHSQSLPIRRLPQALYPHPSEGRLTENHNHRKLTKQITCITGLSDPMNPWAKPCRATQDGWVMVESSDRMWSTVEGNVEPLQHSCLENPMNSMKRQKYMTLKDELPRSVVPNMLLEESRKIVPEGMKRLSQSRNNAQVWMCLVMQVKSDAVKKNIAQEPGMLGARIKVNWKLSNRKWQEWTLTF